MALSALSLHAPAALAADASATPSLPTVEVVGTTPLPGLDTPLRDVPANVQVLGGKDMERQKQSNLGEFLDENPTSVSINSNQGNPFQGDIHFRGFTASPVLGTPQGMSVFLDGVRINEPFGDVVNWDLIPASAISSIQLIPGSNPVFGLNTLGGALSVFTKSGRTHPGGAVEVQAGSFGRKSTSFEVGGKRGNWDYFLTGNLLNDNGWADHNPSRVRQLFGKFGWHDAQTDIDISLLHANNTLEGTQTLPLSMFQQNMRQAYTWPDNTHNKLSAITVKGSRYVNDELILGGNLYFRKYKQSNVSSNINDDYNEKDPASPQALNDRSVVDLDSYGLGLQLTSLRKLAGLENQLTVGASGDFGRAGFTQDSQPAKFTPSRSAVGIGDFERETDAATRNANVSLFFTDTLKLNPQWTLTAAGRYNHTRVKIADRSGTAPELNGDHTFKRFNAALGINYNPTDRLTTYASFNQGSRAPTPIELTCADPQAPCKLPNNFLADPPLKMVRSTTLEVGARGSLPTDTTWSVAVFRTELNDDIQFISASGGASNAGYFQNVGKTRRQGAEVTLGQKWGGLSLSARYSYVDATFQSPFSMHAAGNSSADAANNIAVAAGSRIPGIPRQSLKLRAQYDFGSRASIGANVIYSGSVFARGDENNRDRNGPIPSYTVVHLDGRVEVAKGVVLFGRVTNLFNRQYANAGVLGENYFVGRGGRFDDDAVKEQFLAPGTPRGIWVGLRYQW